MTRRLLVASFAHDHDLLAAIRAARAAGQRIDDVYTPYPVHGLDEALGLRPSRLGYVCFAFGLLGAALALGFQFWTSAGNWPLNVGGRPWNSLPAFIPVTFELTVLCAGLGSVATFLLRYGLLPGRRVRLIDPAVTDDRFVMVIEGADATFDAAALADLCARHGAVAVEERIDDAPAAKEAA